MRSVKMRQEIVKIFVGILKEDNSRDSKHLSAGDIAGVALIGVQELNRKTKRIEELCVLSWW